MKMSNVNEDYEVEDVPVSALFAEGRVNRYGSVAGLDDEELASPEELERQVFLQEWWPILRLPRPKRSPITPNIDEYFGLDWGAFASVDFERYAGEFDKARYKADRLKEQLRDVLIRLADIRERLPTVESKVLKYLDHGIIEIDDIEGEDLLDTARLYLRAKRLQKEIRQLKDVSWNRQKERLAEVLK